MSELKPCPFCGNPDIEIFDRMDESLFSHEQVSWYWIACRKCDAAVPDNEDKDEVVKSWNTRVPDPATVKVLEEALPIIDRLVNSDWAINNYPTLRIKGALELAAQQYDNLNALLTRLKGA